MSDERPSRFPTTRLLPFDEIAEGSVERRRVFSLRSDRVRSRARPHEMVVDRILAPDWVNVVALVENGDEEREIVLVRQWRFAQRGFSVALPGGIVDAGESARSAALRELFEETGYAPADDGDVVDLGFSHPNPALFANVCAHYLVARAVRVGEQELDESEEIEVLHLPLGELDDVIRAHEITDALALVALYRWRTLGVCP